MHEEGVDGVHKFFTCEVSIGGLAFVYLILVILDIMQFVWICMNGHIYYLPKIVGPFVQV